MQTENNEQVASFSKPVGRPWYLSALAAILLIWGATTSLQFLGFTVQALSSGRGPAYLLFFFVYMHALWWALFAAGIGIFRGGDWARWLLAAALLGLLLATAFQPFSNDGFTVVKIIFYPVLIWLTFTKRSSAYFSAAREAKMIASGARVEPSL